MHQNGRLFSLQDLATAAGLPPSRVQYIVGEFADVFGAAAAGSGGSFEPRDIEMLQKLHEKLFLDRKPSATARAELFGKRGARIWAVTSGKGGVGKTTLSVNFAVALAQRGLRVLLFDADFGMANTHVFAGVNPHATLADVFDGRASLAQVVTRGPAGIQMICGASGVARLADLGSRARQAILTELTRLAAQCDLLLIDTGAGISASVLEFLALAEKMIVVTTPNLAATLDAYGVIKAAREAQATAGVEVVVNEAENAATAASVFSRIKGCAERFLLFSPAFLGWLPRDNAFEAASRQRQPVLLAEPDNAAGLRLRELAGALYERPRGDVPARSDRHAFNAAAA